MVTLIIAIVGQLVTLLVVLIQQVFNSKNIEKQSDINYKYEYYKNKVNSYKTLLSKLSVDLDLNNISPKYFDFFYKEVYIYASHEIVQAFLEIYNLYEKYASQKKNDDKDSMETAKLIGYKVGDLHTIAKQEIKNFK